MGALTSSRKRNDGFLTLGGKQPHIKTPEFQSSKRLRFSSTVQDRLVSSRSTVSRVSRYPEAAPRLPREVHAPVRPHKFGFFTAPSQCRATTSAKGSGGEECSGSKMGNILSYKYDKVKKRALDSLRFFEVEEVIELEDEEPHKEVAMSEDSSVEAIEVDDGLKGAQKVPADLPDSGVSGLTNGHVLGVDKTEELAVPMSLDGEDDDDDAKVLSKFAYQKLLAEVHRHDPKLDELDFEIKFNQEKLSSLQLLRTPKKPEEKVPHAPFVPLTDEEEEEVRHALSGNRRKVLVAHDGSGIEITGEILQCLRPRAWLNDEVINLYMELLKEREKREPKNFLKCHFFNTFFYNKLTGKDGYDYKSVRRWTTQRKLGYSLIDCDKIFVPIHQKVHWCLGIINKKEEKFEYLDSLGGRDPKVLKVLAKYFVDEVKDKNGKDIDVRSWKLEYVDDLPEQENSYDCGMFMIKYADFYSRGLGLCFDQEHMPYFRQRTAKEILKLRAD